MVQTANAFIIEISFIIDFVDYITLFMLLTLSLIWYSDANVNIFSW